MKRWFIIGLFVMLALAACIKGPEPVEGPTRKGTFSSELSAIDSLLWQRPDSALACLLPYFDTCCTAEHDRHYAHLLLSELLYKNDYAQTNREELQQAVAYFDSLALAADTRDVAFWDARAHYIYGVGYYEQDSAVPACKEYLKALEIMEERFAEKELVGKKSRFIAYVYTRLMDLFSDMYLHEQTIYFGQAALEYYQQSNAPSRHLARILEEIGSHYDMMCQLDSASYYYHRGMVLLSDTNNLTYRDLSTHLAFLSYNMRAAPSISLDRLKRLIQQAVTDNEVLSRYAIVGEIYYHEKQFDSADFYLSKVFHESQDVSAKKQAAEWLVKICKTQGRSSEAMKYADFLVPFATQDEINGAIKSQLAEFYNDYKQHESEQQNEIKAKKQKKLSIFFISVFVVVLLGVFLLYWRNKQKNKSLEAQMKVEKYAYKMKQKALSGRLKKSNDTLRDTLKKLDEKETEQHVFNHNNYTDFDAGKYEVFKMKPICQELLETEKKLRSSNRNTIKTSTKVADYKDLAMSVPQTTLYTKTVENIFPDLYKRLTTLYPSLDRKEWLHCCLYLLQLDKMSVCVLLQEPYYTCRRYTLRLEEKFGCRQGLSAFLIDQAMV